MNATTERVTSEDGTRIAYRRTGTGPRILVLHGRLGTSMSWLAVALELARDAPIRRLVLYEPGVNVAGLIPAEQGRAHRATGRRGPA